MTCTELEEIRMKDTGYFLARKILGIGPDKVLTNKNIWDPENSEEQAKLLLENAEVQEYSLRWRRNHGFEIIIYPVNVFATCGKGETFPKAVCEALLKMYK